MPSSATERLRAPLELKERGWKATIARALPGEVTAVDTAFKGLVRGYVAHARMTAPFDAQQIGRSAFRLVSAHLEPVRVTRDSSMIELALKSVEAGDELMTAAVRAGGELLVKMHELRKKDRPLEQITQDYFDKFHADRMMQAARIVSNNPVIRRRVSSSTNFGRSAGN